jgi:hypothetical protein
MGGGTTHAERALGSPQEASAMSDFVFKVNLVAVVRVRADDETVAREAVPTVLGSPSTAEIGLANQNNAALGADGTITDANFRIEDGEITLVEMRPIATR